MNNKYTVVFPAHLEGGFTDLVLLMKDAIHCPIVRTLKEVPTNSRPIMIGAHELPQRMEWGNLRDDMIIYETEQHSWWLVPEYMDWLKKYTVWSLFKNTIPNSIYVPTGYSTLFDIPYATYESTEKWIDADETSRGDTSFIYCTIALYYSYYHFKQAQIY